MKNRYTEDQAKRRWCPFARVKATGMERNSFNRLFSGVGDERRSDTNPPSSRCIASECMAWQFTSDETGFCGMVRS